MNQIVNRKPAKAGPALSNIKKERWSYITDGFTLVEVLVVLALLSLIVFALMAVFAATQRAFRASITQSDSLGGGRAVMDLIASDMEGMTPSNGQANTNSYPAAFTNAQNFFANPTAFYSPPSPLIQPLIGSVTGASRTNVLENIFALSQGNINGTPCWIGAGYSVNTNLADGTLYPLYRFYMTNAASAGTAGAWAIFTNFNALQYNNITNWSHLMDGVVHLTVRAYDTNGIWMTNGYAFLQTCPLKNTYFYTPYYGEVGFLMMSNALPASVEIELGTLEDQTLQHAQALSGIAQSNYLAGAAAQVHLFRQRVWIRNLDPTAYQ